MDSEIPRPMPWNICDLNGSIIVTYDLILLVLFRLAGGHLVTVYEHPNLDLFPTSVQIWAFPAPSVQYVAT